MSIDPEEREWGLFLQEAGPAAQQLEALAQRFQSETIRLYLSELRENLLSLLDGESRDAA